MSEYDIAHLITSPRPLYQLFIPPIEDEEGKIILLKHGCRIEEYAEECIIYFPEGTTKIEMFLRNIHPRYRITLPDGYELRELYDRYQNIHVLFYPSEQTGTTIDIWMSAETEQNRSNCRAGRPSE